MIDNYKVAFIYGEDDERRDIKNGKIEMIGNIHDENEIHIICLLEHAKERYPDIEIFKRLNNRHTPDIAGYFFTLLGHIVFFNTTKNIEKYGKTGMFMMPKSLSDNQRKTLIEFVENLEEYHISICYDLDLVDGILEAKELYPLEKEKPLKLLGTYLQRENKEIKTK